MTPVELGLDPGKAHLGWGAKDERGRIVAAGVVRVKVDRRAPTRTGIRIGRHRESGTVTTVRLVDDLEIALSRARLDVVRVISEFPHVYRAGRSKADPEDLLYCALCVGAVAGRLAPADGVRLVEPAEWKGQVPDEPFWARVRKRLTPEEAEICKAAGVYDATGSLGAQFHHGLEAVGILLWADMRI